MTVTLRDGRQVSNSSEEWRHECEARSVVAMPTREARRKHLELVAQLRGPTARERLEVTARELWEELRAVAALQATGPS